MDIYFGRLIEYGDDDFFGCTNCGYVYYNSETDLTGVKCNGCNCNTIVQITKGQALEQAFAESRKWRASLILNRKG